MFDAGSIQAHLDIEMAKADADLRKIEDRVKKLENTPHHIRIDATFDTASVGRARQMMAQLDNAISRDAMTRLRSSPQGSVIGTLMALFSPHPVSGAPSPQQAAQQGLLGKIVGPSGTASRGVTTVLGGTAGPTSTIRDPSSGRIITVQQGGESQGIKDAARDIKAAASDVKDSAASGRQAADSMRDAATDVREASTGIRGIGNTLRGLIGGRGGSSGGGGGAGRVAAGTLGGIGPGIPGVSVRNALLAALGGTGLAALPALAGAGLAGGVLGGGVGLISAGAHALIGQKNTKANPNAEGPLFAQGQAAGKALQEGLQSAARGMLAPLRQALTEIPSLVKGIEPALKSAFAGAGTLIMPLVLSLDSLAKDVLPLLGQAFRATAPLVRPLIGGLDSLLKGVLPGVVTLLKAAGPAVQAFGQVLGDIGHGLGTMLSQFAPVIKASSKVLESLGDVVSAIFPVIGKLAQVFATALAPVIEQFAGVIKALLPFITTLGKIIADLAGAVLGDLSSAFGALAQLLKAVAPSLDLLAKSLTGVFTLLENSGVFATFGDALENVVPLIAQLVNALVSGLVPILPPVIQFFGQISSILIGTFTQALTAILPLLTQLATVVLQALAKVLPVILPVLASVLGAFTGAVATDIAAIATGLSNVLAAVPPGVLQGVAVAVGAIVVALKAWRAVQAVLDIELTANPVGIVVVALAALAAGLTVAWQKSAAFRDAVKAVADAMLAVGVVVVQANQAIVDSFLSMVGTVLHGAADAFGWVPGLGHALRAASDGFDSFKDHVDNGFNRMIDTMHRWQDGLTGARQAMDTATAVIVSDLTRSGQATDSAKAAVNQYTQAVQNNGATSSAARSARQALIADLERAGLNADQAHRLVNNLTTAIGNLHGKAISISMTGSGTYSIKQLTGQGLGVQGPPPGVAHAASGMYVSQGKPGVDDQLIYAQRGELVVPTSMVSSGEVDHLRGRIPGFASGGVVGGNLNGAYITNMAGDFQKQMTDAMVAAMRAAIKQAAAAAAAQFVAGHVNYNPGAGVSQWRGVVSKALSMLGLNQGFALDVLYQMQTESGGNPRAVNLWDSNAAAGHPSVGLMQVIHGTYATYGAPRMGYPAPVAYGVSEQPLANVYAALNYGKHGKGFGTGPGQIGSGHGYASGTPWAWPGLALVGERGPEVVGFGGGEKVLSASQSGGLLGQINSLTGAIQDLTSLISAGTGGGFQLTRESLGLPPPPKQDTGGGAGGGAGGDTGGGDGTGTGTGPPKKKTPARNASQKRAIAVLGGLLGGYVAHNQLGLMRQDVALLDWLGDHSHDGKVSQIAHLDSLLLGYRKAKNKKAEKAAEQLLKSLGVRSFSPVTAVHGNKPGAAVGKSLEAFMKLYIHANNMQGAGQANAILTHVGIGKYTAVLREITYLDKLLARYMKAHDTKDVRATETLLRGYGVQHFAAGGVVWEPVTGVGQRSGRLYQFAEHQPERVSPGTAGGGSAEQHLARIARRMDDLIRTTAAVPRGVAGGVGDALGDATRSASFRSRYPAGRP